MFSDYANTGIYILNSDALELIPKDTDFDFSKDLFPEMLRRGMKIRGHVTDAISAILPNTDKHSRIC